MTIDLEREFHDTRFAAGGSRGFTASFYEGARRSRERYRSSVFEAAVRGRALEIGCGPNGLSLAIASLAREVTGVDISGVAVRQARDRAVEEGATNARFFEMDAHALEFAPDSFDVVFGAGILHHIDVARAYEQIARVLAPGGRAVFLEPLGHNPLINLYRRMTPRVRTADEHPLLLDDLERAKDCFERVDARFFHLSAPAVGPARRLPGYGRLLNTMERCDEALLATVPALRKYAWIVVLTLERPR
jgi:SAM-dependent methyltransferase